RASWLDREGRVVTGQGIVEPAQRLQNDSAAVQEIRVSLLDRYRPVDQRQSVVVIAALVLDDREQVVRNSAQRMRAHNRFASLSGPRNIASCQKRVRLSQRSIDRVVLRVHSLCPMPSLWNGRQ